MLQAADTKVHISLRAEKLLARISACKMTYTPNFIEYEIFCSFIIYMLAVCERFWLDSGR